jgi:hypothetical protein
MQHLLHIHLTCMHVPTPQDLDSGRHGSGFPLPSWRGLPTDARTGRGIRQSAASKHYAEHPWNVNNVPRSKNSLLRYMEVSQPITGIMVPWLYVGSCLSAFCWHVEDHALCSINYLHLGAPKVGAVMPAVKHVLRAVVARAQWHVPCGPCMTLYECHKHTHRQRITLRPASLMRAALMWKYACRASLSSLSAACCRCGTACPAMRPPPLARRCGTRCRTCSTPTLC